MRIKEIELDNFKSFGKLTNVPILPGFTTVSGPNGSGKSNIVDSLMFALGLATTRNMRAERLTDLLNNLTGRKELSVRVVFIDDETQEETEVIRKVRVKTNGYDSKYFLNGEASTLTQIHDKLGAKNISPSGFNVVMQGDVASIISMNSKERRGIIDEIAGVAEFDRKIELSQKELEVVLERIENQEVILNEIKSRLKQLQKERDQAIKYAELRDKRTELERQFLAVRIKQLKNDKEKAEKELEELKQLKTDLQIENNTINEDMGSHQEKLNKLSDQINALGEGKQRELGLKRDDKKEALAKEESAFEYLQKQITDQTEQQEKLTKEIKDIKKNLKNIDFKKQEFEEELNAARANIKEEEARYTEIQEKIKQKSANSNVSSNAVILAQEEIAKLKEAKAQIEQEQARLEEQLLRANADLEKHKIEAEKVSTRLKTVKEQANMSGLHKIDALREQIEFQTGNATTLKDEYKDTKEELEKQQKKLHHIQRELDQMEGQERAADAAGFGRAVEMVLDRDGVHGTLAQLGSVDSKYQLAVETAAGARLRAVVTDDDYVASECIDYLRDNRAGRATFLPLNKLRKATDLPKATDKGIIGWAIDLVQFDESYKDAFGYAFANTLVVKNLDVGRRMIGRFRMVTLEGDLIERSGAMTGGAAIKSNIHFGENLTSKRGNLEKQKTELQEFISQLQSELEEMENQMEESRSKADKLKNDLASKEKASGSSMVQIQSLEEAYEREKNNLTEASKAINELEEKLEKINDKVFVKDKEIEKEDKKLQELAAEMKDSGLEALVQEGQEIEVEIKRYQTMLNNLENESKGLEVEKNFNEQNIQKLQTEIEGSQEEVVKLQEKVPERESAIKTIQEEIDTIDKEIDEIRRSLAHLQEERDKISEELLALGQRRGEVTSKIESTAIKIVESKKKIASMKEHLDQLLEELKEHPELEDVELPEEDITKLQAELNRIEKQMRAMEPVNMRAVEEYEEVSSREAEIIEKQAALTNEREMLIEKIDSFANDKKKTFMESFDKVNSYFQETFTDLSFGHGQLILEDPEEIFNAGLIIKAQPRDKKMQRLEAMSGGEKSLTALSFLFALQQCNPAPFYAFDEVDSALDGINVERLASKIARNSKTTQFIVVSHRRPMINQSDRAVGVSVGRDGFSKIIGVKNIKEEGEEEGKELVEA